MIFLLASFNYYYNTRHGKIETRFLKILFSAWRSIPTPRR